MLHKLLTLIVLGIMPFFTGCWDVEEVNRQSAATTAFFDVGNQKKYIVGGVFTIPGTLLPPVTGTDQQFNKRYYSLKGEGDTLLNAWSELQSNSMRNVFFGQTQAIILSNEFANKNINNLLDFIGRRYIVPSNANLIISKTPPEILTEMKVNNNMPAGTYIQTYFQSKPKDNLALPVTLWDVYKIMDNKTGDPWIPLIKPSQGQYKISGVALFSQNRKVGELDINETKILSLLKETASGIISVPLGKNKSIGFSDVTSITKIKPRITDNGQLIYNIKVDITGRVAEIYPHKDNFTTEDKEMYQQMAGKYINGEIEKLIYKLQQLNSDPIELRGKLRVYYPNIWEKSNWNQLYKSARFNITTNFKFFKTGLFM